MTVWANPLKFRICSRQASKHALQFVRTSELLVILVDRVMVLEFSPVVADAVSEGEAEHPIFTGAGGGDPALGP